MTATLGDVPKRREKPEPTAEQQVAEELVRWAREQGLSPTGPSTRPSGSPWPGRKTSWGCGPAPGGGREVLDGRLADIRNRGVRDVFFVVCDCEDDRAPFRVAA
jgi:hypothetical protein